MNEQPRTLQTPYPEVENLLLNDPTPKSEAVYIPSVSPGYAKIAYSGNWERDLPKGVTAEQMNFLHPSNKLFRLSHVMSSAGQALNQKKPCIITERDRRVTFVIGDSGGYQVANSGTAITGDSFREKTLRWLEDNADVAMTLDVPTWPLQKKMEYRYKSVKECLDASIENLEYFRAHRRNSNTVFLNVLQGNSTPESDAWYNAVKHFDFEGWAFAGRLRNNFYNLCRRILKMADEGQIEKKKWIHVLGTNELATGVCLTALQRAINRYINPHLRISYDTSTPFRMLSWGSTFSLPKFDRMTMVLSQVDFHQDAEYMDSDLRWPWPSAFGDKLRMKDIIVHRGRGKSVGVDTQGSHYLSYHNLCALCNAVALANRIFDCTSLTNSHRIAMPVGAAVEAINEVFKSGSIAKLDGYKTTFEKLRKETPSEVEDDADRSVWN